MPHFMPQSCHYNPKHDLSLKSNQVVFVPKPNQTFTTALSHHKTSLSFNKHVKIKQTFHYLLSSSDKSGVMFYKAGLWINEIMLYPLCGRVSECQTVMLCSRVVNRFRCYFPLWCDTALKVVWMLIHVFFVVFFWIYNCLDLIKMWSRL